MQTLLAMPARFAAGETVAYSRAIDDFKPSEGWTLKLFLARTTTTEIVASDDGTSFIITLTAAITAGMDAGLYNWTERVEKSGEKYVVDSGRVTITPNLELATDSREWAEVALDLVRTALTGKLTDAMDHVQIGSRIISSMSSTELFAAEALLEGKLIRLRQGSFTRSVKITFGGA